MLILVRHGESTANAAGLLLGRTDAPLTDAGRRQAGALASHLGPVVEVRSSPLERAVGTAEALHTGRPVAVDDRWVELDYGVHDGRPLKEVPAEVWRQWRADPRFRPEGGESMSELEERVAGACEELFARAGEGARSGHGDVVVVSHVSPIKAAVRWALGVGDQLAFRLHLSTGSLTRIGWGVDGPTLHSFNEVPVTAAQGAAATADRTESGGPAPAAGRIRG